MTFDNIVKAKLNYYYYTFSETIWKQAYICLTDISYLLNTQQYTHKITRTTCVILLNITSTDMMELNRTLRRSWQDHSTYGCWWLMLYILNSPLHKHQKILKICFMFWRETSFNFYKKPFNMKKSGHRYPACHYLSAHKQ